MKNIYLIIICLSLVGCSLIPSKWDSNEAKAITDIQLSTRYFDCNNVSVELNQLQKQIEWFQLYSKFKGSNDIVELFKEISSTVSQFKERSSNGHISPMYCDLKKKILIQQADITAKAIQGRFQ